MEFIESIRHDAEGYHLLDLHQDRINETFNEFFPNDEPHELTGLLPKIQDASTQKVRLIYSGDTFNVEVIPYQSKKVTSLKIVDGNHISYSYKKEDRTALDALYHQKGGADDIIILKNKLVTDSYYANLAFWDGSRWITPKSYMLKGVKRTHLLQQSMLKESEIKAEDIYDFEKVSLINAMLDLNEVFVEISRASIF